MYLPQEVQMKAIKYSVLAAVLVGSAVTLSACAGSDGYYGRSSYSVGVSSSSYDRGRGYGDRDLDGVPNRYDRDRDGDGVPNRFDNRPGNPYVP